MVRAPRRQARHSAWLNLILGLGILVLPFLLGPDERWHHWSNYMAGTIIAFLAMLTLVSPHRRTQGALAGGIFELAFGVWVMATALIARASDAYLWANLLLGAAVVAVSVWSLGVGASAAKDAR